MESSLSAWLSAQLQGFDTNAYGVSHVLQVTPTSVYKWLDGTHTPSPDNCRKLAQFFAVPEEEVLILAGHLSGPAPATHEPVPFYLPHNTPELRRALALFCELDPPDRHRILTIMEALRGLQDEPPRSP